MQTDAPEMTGAPAPKLARPLGPAGWRSRLKALAARAVPASVLVKRGIAGAPRVALTFDDGPHEMTDAYLDVLDRFGARATFFVVGRECEKHPEALLRPVILGGKLVEEPWATAEIRDYCSQARSRVSAGHRVEYSSTLLQLAERHRSEAHP